MHLRDACIDLDGQITALGRIEYPPDRTGYFPLPTHTHVRIGVFDAELRLAAAVVERDERSHFLVSQEVGPVVFVPESLTAIIRGALRSYEQPCMEALLLDQQKTLESGGNRETAKMQPLSDWRLRLSIVDGTLKVNLSAALEATRPIPAWQKRSTDNFWGVTGDTAPVIAIEFEVNIVTRVVSCQARFDPPNATPATLIEPRQSSLLDLKLEEAPIGSDGGMFGYSPNKRWVSFNEHGAAGIVIATARLKRLPSGFVDDSNERFWPRIWLKAFNMEDMVHAIRETLKLTIELNDGCFGHLEQNRQFGESYESWPVQLIHRARLEFQLNFLAFRCPTTSSSRICIHRHVENTPRAGCRAN